ncbi:MAG: methylmalonyl Co-A mutase-associated GTPase MeaB, partial [Romboutsia sp.]|nr:methylmalonyl Co-A mutase-associated GTPase MeaB [Romboutsia sp.]
VFIRSMGTRGSLGGLSNATQSAIKVLDAYGCEYIFIETVGVGQSEIDIVKTADTTVMLMVPGLGDDIQAIKAGVMEIADLFVVNKCDKDGAKKTALEIEMMLDFRKDWDFRPQVDMVISETGKGIDKVYEDILKHKEFLTSNNILQEKRLERNKIEVRELVQKEIIKLVNKLQYSEDIDNLLLKTMTKEIDPYSVSRILIEKITNTDVLKI